MNVLKYIYYGIKIATLLLITNVMISCTDLLEPKPITQLPDLNSVFDTRGRILAQVNGLYAGLKSGNFLGGRMQMYLDVRGEDFQNRTNNGVTGLFAWNHSQAPSNAEVTNAWSAGYATINRVNVFLKGLDDNPGIITDAEANQCRAEARTIRAMAYFYLSQLYCRPFSLNSGNNPGLPLRLTANTTDSGVSLARSTVAAVYTQILADLNFAELNLPLDNGSPLLNTTRMHRNSVIAFKVRVYLVMGNYANVLTEAARIVGQTTAPFSSTSGVMFSLAPNILSVFSTPYTAAESILSMPMSSADVPGTQNALAGYYLPGNISGGAAEYRFDAAGIISNPAFAPTTDARYTSLTILVTTPAASAGRWCFKYRNTPPPIDFVPVMRYSEVLLSYAEALARENMAGVDATALALLNAVRTRSSGSAYTSAGLATSAALVNAILLERRIEFFGEGIRSIDITRLQLPFRGTITTAAQNYVWPIPQAELDNNPAMVQN